LFVCYAVQSKQNDPIHRQEVIVESNLRKIDHIVVLMLENRSFDNMLGFLGKDDPGGQKVNGVARTPLSNPIPEYARTADGPAEVPVGIETVMTNPNPDPGEEYAHVNVQLFGQVIPEANRFTHADKKPARPYNLPKRASYTDAPMNGFVTDYINHLTALNKDHHIPAYDEYKIIMNCHREESIPVLSTLAREFAVFDAWHASVPSQTLPNRSFVHSGTSFGYVLNKPVSRWLLREEPTLFNRIQDKRDPEITWRIYYDRLDIVSSTYLLHRTLWKYRKANVRLMEDFEHDAAEGTLPSYSFIEPRFFIDHNDQHPPLGDMLETSNVLAGELLINRVYNAVRTGKHWDRTLLIITYDEHGGCYDHVPPPAAFPPDQGRPVGEQGFRFDRLGVRVPTVMVSPYIEKGTVISDVHDHTSILKVVCERWGLEPLTERDRRAASFSQVLSRDTPRLQEEMPHIIPCPYLPPQNSLDEPINPLQHVILLLAVAVEEAVEVHPNENLLDRIRDFFQLVRDEDRVAHIKTVGEAIDFFTRFDQRVTPTHLPFWNRVRMHLKLFLHSR
jgi:phospholipase C